MIRRLAIAVAALLGAVVLTSCATFDRNDTVASVNDLELSQDDLQVLVESELGIELLNEAPVEGRLSGDGARGLIGAWVALHALEQAGLTADSDIAGIQADLGEQFGEKWTNAPKLMQELATLNVAIGTKVQQGTLSQDQVLAAVTGADVFVDSRYGSWDASNARVVPLG